MDHVKPQIRKRELAQLQTFTAPNVICFTRAERPPIPGQRDGDTKKPLGDETEGQGTANKKALCGLSSRSSLNLARLLSSLEWSRLGTCVHVTLTYHREWPEDRDALDLAKMSLSKALSRHCEAGIWRLEYQSRNEGKLRVPHWHVLLWIGNRDLGEFEEWCRSWWASCSGNASAYAVHFSAGTEGRSTWYLALHHSKRDQAPNFFVGRWWGYISRARLLEACDIQNEGPCGERTRVWWARLYRRATGARLRAASGFSWFLPKKWHATVNIWVQDTIKAELIERSVKPCKTNSTPGSS